MLSSLKEKILNVTQTVPLLGSEDKTQKNSELGAININAGAKILQRYQHQWEIIHNVNEENANAAKEVAEKIDQISTKVNLEKQNLSQISHILTNSNLAHDVFSCVKKIEELYKISETVEKSLINLEIVIDEIEFEKNKKQHQYHLEQYEIKKYKSLHSFKSALEKNHQKKAAEYEESKKVVIEQRQKIFQDAFKNDLEMYKNRGAIPEVDNTKKNQNSALLEEIELDFDQNELDQFFNENGNVLP